MVTRSFLMYSLADLGVTSSNYSFGSITNTGSFTASGAAAPTAVVVDDTDSQNTVFNDGAPGSFGASPTQQLLTGNVDGTNFSGVPSNPENEFQVTDSNGDVVGFIYDLHNANSASFASLQGYVSTFELIPGEAYTVARTTGLPRLSYSDLITCFTSNTLIDTGNGKRLVQDIEVGDVVATLDHGLQKVRWKGATVVPGVGNFAPIRIQKGALGNSRTMRVSPQHRMLIIGWRAQLLFGQEQILVAAKHLTNGDTIVREEMDEVEYIHIMFEQHEIIFAEDCPSESFLLSDASLGAQDQASKKELLGIFPELVSGEVPNMRLARLPIRSYEAKALLSLSC